MIRGNRASLAVRSDAYTVAQISEMLGREPDQAGDIGDLTAAGRAGRDLAPERLRYQRTFWTIDEKDAGEGEDRTGFASLRRLVEDLVPLADALARLRRGGETILWWSGDSDSAQGGFVLESDLIAALSRIGCDVYGTAHLEDPDPPRGDSGCGAEGSASRG